MTTSISTSARGFGGALDLGVAALAAASIGFVAFAMPQDLFSSLISASHLPDLIAAAAPPLGMKARYAVVGGCAGIGFILVWSLLRALEGAPAKASPAAPIRGEPEVDAPRVRRADAHPDAPARRPLLAGADLGEPETDPYDADEPAPVFGRRFPAPEPAFDPALEPDFASAAEPVIDPAPQPAAGEGRLPRFLVTQEEAPLPARDPIVPPTQKRAAEAFGSRIAPPPVAEGADSIGTLMQRLERGLADRDETIPLEEPMAEPELPPSLAQASANPDLSLSPEGVRHRLRNAISDLNQVAGRG